jgi:fructoselysine-6-P-deglycase FrlB-like protein
MSEIMREIAAQPACWRRGADPDVARADLLPRAGGRAAVVGCGTSLHIAQAYAVLRESRGIGETDAFPASEYPSPRRYDDVLAISRSGTTTEVLRLLQSPELRTTRRTVVSAVEASPVVAAADAALVLDFADERSVVQTRFATTALAVLRVSLGEDIEPIAAEAAAAIEEGLPVDPTRFDHFVFLGEGWSTGLANEAALKIREAAGAWSESYPAMEYRHGPISVAGPSSLVWALGDVDAGVLDDAARTGATVVARRADPMAELVRIQRAAVAVADARGLDPDHPRHLSRSVVLS